MTCELELMSPAGRLYRVGRMPTPWRYPDWAFVGPDGTFGSRWNDPDSSYRVLYASSSRLGAFLEVLARFRPDPASLAGLDRIHGDAPSKAGIVPSGWLAGRLIGGASFSGTFADVGRSRSLAYLRTVMAARLVHYGVDLDASAVRLSVPRAFTQEISRIIYECTSSDGSRAFQGIRYLSRLGDDLENWAIFEPLQPAKVRIHPIAADDLDLREALERLGLILV